MKICKLGLIFLVCFVLAQCQEVEETEKSTEVNDTENDVPPEKSKSPDNVETPKKEESPDSTEKPETPETPEKPEKPETPETPEKPETPETHETTANPETPESEEESEKPVTPGKRQTPKPEEEENTDREREPMSPFPGEDSTPASSEDSPQGQPDITLITIGRIPITPRCLLCNFPRNPNFARSPFRPIGGDGASFFRIPNPRFQPPPESPNRGNPGRGFQGFTPNPSNDPLKNFTRPQRLRQLMQDMISYQLKKFENIMNEFMTAIEDEKEKKAMDNVLNGLKQFSQVLKDNQLFDFKVILQNTQNPRNKPLAPSEDSDYEFVGSETENVDTSNKPRFEPLVRITGLFK